MGHVSNPNPALVHVQTVEEFQLLHCHKLLGAVRLLTGSCELRRDSRKRPMQVAHCVPAPRPLREHSLAGVGEGILRYIDGTWSSQSKIDSQCQRRRTIQGWGSRIGHEKAFAGPPPPLPHAATLRTTGPPFLQSRVFPQVPLAGTARNVGHALGRRNPGGGRGGLCVGWPPESRANDSSCTPSAEHAGFATP